MRRVPAAILLGPDPVKCTRSLTRSLPRSLTLPLPPSLPPSSPPHALKPGPAALGIEICCTPPPPLPDFPSVIITTLEILQIAALLNLAFPACRVFLPLESQPLSPPLPLLLLRALPVVSDVSLPSRTTAWSSERGP